MDFLQIFVLTGFLCFFFSLFLVHGYFYCEYNLYDFLKLDIKVQCF